MYKFLVIFSQFNNSDKTINAINSIQECSNKNLLIDVLVVDDCSTDNTNSEILAKLSKINNKIIFKKNEKNLGYFKSLAVNLKNDLVKNYDYAWLGNNDVYDFSKNYFEEANDIFLTNSKIAACSGSVKNEKGEENFSVKKKYFLENKELSDVGFFVKVSLLPQIGYFSEYFNYEFCDVNFESRLKKKGFECVFIPSINLKHSTKSETRKIFVSKKNTISRYRDFVTLFKLEKKLFTLSFCYFLIRDIKVFYKKKPILVLYAIVGVFLGLLRRLN